MYFEEGGTSFNTFDIGSVGQRATKLLAVKVGVLNKKSATSAIPAEVCIIRVWAHLGLNQSQILTAGNFEAL